MAHPMLSPPPPDGVVPEIRGVVPKPAKQRWFKPLLMSLPSQVRYFLSLIAFWPTAAIARIFAWAMPQNRRVWDRVDDHVILGAAPFFRSELEDLYHKQRVRGIVNMCREWNYHVDWYRANGFTQLHLPTIDYDVPDLRDCIAGANFIADTAAAGGTTYVHCKAGRGRSTAVVLAYLVLYRGMPPHEAHDHVKRRRAHISERWSAPELQACWRLRQSLGASRSPEQYSALLAELGRLSSPEVHARLIAPARSHEAADAAAAGTGGAGAGAARPASAGAAAAASASGASAADVEPRKLR